MQNCRSPDPYFAITSFHSCRAVVSTRPLRSNRGPTIRACQTSTHRRISIDDRRRKFRQPRTSIHGRGVIEARARSHEKQKPRPHKQVDSYCDRSLMLLRVGSVPCAKPATFPLSQGAPANASSVSMNQYIDCLALPTYSRYAGCFCSIPGALPGTIPRPQGATVVATTMKHS